MVGAEGGDFLAAEVKMARKGLGFEGVDYEAVAGSLTSVDSVSAASPPELQFGVADYEDRAFQEAK